MARQQPLPQSQKPKQLQLPDPPPPPPPQQQPLANEMAMLATEMAGLASEMATVKVENAQLLRILNKVKSQLVAVQSEVDELRGGASAGAGTGVVGMTRQESDGANAVRTRLVTLLASNVDHYRSMHATREELVLTARLSDALYAAKLVADKERPGYSAEDWDYFRTLSEDDEELEQAVRANVKGHKLANTPGWVERVCETIKELPDMAMVGYCEPTDASFDGAAAVFRSDLRKMLVVCWAGPPGAEVVTGLGSGIKTYRSAPWCSSDLKVTHKRYGSAAASPGMAGVELGAEKALEGSDSKSPLTHTMGRRAQLRVAAGFLQQYLGEGLNRRVNEVIKEQVASFAGYSVLVTGHSLGGALATLSAFEVASTFLDRQVLLTTFGSPRVVNAEFARVLGKMPNLRAYRVANELDPVTRVPPANNGFHHVGHMVWLHNNRVEPPRSFGSTPLQVSMAPSSSSAVDEKPAVLGGVGRSWARGRRATPLDVGATWHSSYVARLCEPPTECDWARYEKALRVQAKRAL